MAQLGMCCLNRIVMNPTVRSRRLGMTRRLSATPVSHPGDWSPITDDAHPPVQVSACWQANSVASFRHNPRMSLHHEWPLPFHQCPRCARWRGTQHPCRKLDSHAAQVTLRNALLEFRGNHINCCQWDYAGSSDDSNYVSNRNASCRITRISHVINLSVVCRWPTAAPQVPSASM
jgi:hypothetical protein